MCITIVNGLIFIFLRRSNLTSLRVGPKAIELGLNICAVVETLPNEQKNVYIFWRLTIEAGGKKDDHCDIPMEDDLGG